MRNAEDIRQHVYEHHIKPAREMGLDEVVILAKCVRQEMGGYLDPTAVMGALTAKTRLDVLGVELAERIGKGRGWKGVRYQLLDSHSSFLAAPVTQSVHQQIYPKSSPSSDYNEEQEVIKDITERILELTPGEFQELAREYMRAKGFADAQIEVVIKMKM